MGASAHDDGFFVFARGFHELKRRECMIDCAPACLSKYGQRVREQSSACDISHVTCHMSLATCHMSHVTCHM